jgi:hypothetical protein
VTEYKFHHKVCSSEIVLLYYVEKVQLSSNFVWRLNNNKKRCKNNKSLNFAWGLNNNKKGSKHNMSPKLCLGAIITVSYYGSQTKFVRHITFALFLLLLIIIIIIIIIPLSAHFCPSLFSEMPWSNLIKPCRNIICHVKLCF